MPIFSIICLSRKAILPSLAGLLLLSVTEGRAAELTIEDGSATEGNANARTLGGLRVTLSPASTRRVTVQVAASSSQATARVDYGAKRGRLVFLPGETSQVIYVPVYGDTLDEAHETVQVTLSNPVGATLARSQATFTILDDDPEPTVSFTSASQSVAEGGNATVTLQLSAASGLDVTIPLAASGTATSDDYTVSATSVRIPAGQTQATVTVNTLSDQTAEGNETVILSLGTPTYAAVGSSGTHTVTISGTSAPVATGSFSFRSIPAGCFQMGGTSYSSGSLPVHEVCVGAFEIGTYEVTQGEWQQVMGSNPSNFPNCGINCPVEQVSWTDVQTFIQRMNARGNGYQYRLPTEAEWEYACRGGTAGQEYCGGNDVNAVGWYSYNSGSITHPVGQKVVNGFGLYDMSGNVREWVSDWYSSSYYASSPRTNPTGPTTGSDRVVRGGSSWGSIPGSLSSAYRYYNSPGIRNIGLGFRLLRTRQ